MLDASFGGLVLLKTIEEAITIIEYIAFTNMWGQHWRTQT